MTRILCFFGFKVGDIQIQYLYTKDIIADC